MKKPNSAQEFIERYGRVFSPSGSGRWLFCTGSVALETQLKDREPDRKELPSIYASRGTVAHAIAAKCIQNDVSPYSFVGENIVSEDEAQLEISVDAQMADAVDQYVEFALELMEPQHKPIYAVEVSLDLSHISPYMPSGTADLWVYQQRTGHLHIGDYKNGVIDVDPVHNTQMMVYALGVLNLLKQNHGIKASDINRVSLHIAQPNARNSSEPIRTWETSVDALLWFHEFVRSTIHHTISGNLIFAPSESRCRWCRGAAVCTERAQLAIEAAKLDFHDLMAYEDQTDDNTSPIGQLREQVIEPKFPPVDTLTPREIGHILRWQDKVQQFFSAVGEYALDLKKRGQHVPYMKLVRGRSNRQWALSEDETKIELKKEFELTDDEMFEKPKFKSPAKIEAILKQKKIDRTPLEVFITKPEGEFKLAPVTDKRPEVRFEKQPQNDFAAFKS